METNDADPNAHKRRRPSPASVALVAVLLALVAAGVRWGFLVGRAGMRQVFCHQNLEEVSLQLALYSSDHDEHLPIADEWCDALLPYCYGQRDRLQCPASETGEAGYVMNAALSGAKVQEITDPGQTVVAFDGYGPWNASGGEGEVAVRHGTNAPSWNVVFADSGMRTVRQGDGTPLKWTP
jgi:hypothetical protein